MSSHEALRQQALIAAIEASDTGDTDGTHGIATAVSVDLLQPSPPLSQLQLRETGARAARGLEVYRANAQASADRALVAAFATVRAMVGADDFSHLAHEFWRACPPQHGDMGEWGLEFPAWLAAHPGLAPWPYLGDCARLDLALHINERAADADLDAASLALLDECDPERTHLAWMPGVRVLSSPWPIATIHHAHQVDADERERAFGAVRAALAAPRAQACHEHVLVARKGWRAVVHRLDAAEAGFAHSVQRGASLGAALAEAGSGFDFAHWLGRALQEAWLKGMVVSGD